jgi:prolyl-tRNA synthetase
VRPWSTSWGSTTRLIGGMIMTHGDDSGLVMPPKVAPYQVVIVPIPPRKGDINEAVLPKAREVAAMLRGAGLRVHLDDRDQFQPGYKYADWEMRGVPLRLEIGPKDIEKEQCVIVRRDTGEKHFVPLAHLQEEVRRLLDAVQQSLFEKARTRTHAAITPVADWAAFEQADKDKKLILASHCGKKECEQEIKEVTRGITARCIPLKNEKPGHPTCVRCGQKSKYQAYFARAY